MLHDNLNIVIQIFHNFIWKNSLYDQAIDVVYFVQCVSAVLHDLNIKLQTTRSLK